MERHYRVTSIVYRNICVEYGLETIGTEWETPPKVVVNDQTKVLWGFQIQTKRLVDKHWRKAVVIDVTIPSDSHIRKKEHEKQEKNQGQEKNPSND